MLTIIVALLLAQAEQPPEHQPLATVVATQSNPVLVERISRVHEWSSAVGMPVIDAVELERRLTAIASPKLIDPETTRAHLAEADESEARYDMHAAEELRNDVVRDFDASAEPSMQLATLAARALHGLSAANLHDGKPAEARTYAREALIRFPHVPLDTQRFPPDIDKLFKQVAKDLKRMPKTEVTFVSTAPGHVYANGNDVGTIDKKLTVKLPQGRYIAWLGADNHTSLAHAFTVASSPLTVEIDLALEQMLALQPIPTLQCAPTCDAALRRLATIAHVDQAIGLELIDDAEVARGLYVKADDGSSDTKVIAALANPERLLVSDSLMANAMPPAKPFSPWLLVPFGVGQFSQKRYVAGSIYAGIEAGLAAWHISCVIRDHNEDTAHERSIRHQRNLSGGLLIGAVVANIAEALIVNAMTPAE